MESQSALAKRRGNFWRQTEIDFPFNESISSEASIFLKEFTLLPWRQQNIQFALPASVKGHLVKSTYAGDEASVHMEKGKNFYFTNSKWDERYLCSSFAAGVSSQQCMWSIALNFCLFFPVVKCMRRIQAPAMLIFEEALQQEAHSRELS